MSVTIQDYTTKIPLQMIGEEAGACWGANTADSEKNIKRAIDCIASNHGRTLEFPQVYMTIDGYSARVMRELYTHIGGAPTRLQESTRYIKYGEFDYITPPSIKKNEYANTQYTKIMREISDTYKDLLEEGIKKEDIANILPLGMVSKVVVRTNLRNLIDMSRQRMCARAYWEFQTLMKDIADALVAYSPEWEEIVKMTFYAKCKSLGYCPESHGCGKYPKKEFDN